MSNDKPEDSVTFHAETLEEAIDMSAYADNECNYHGKPVVIMYQGDVFSKSYPYSSD